MSLAGQLAIVTGAGSGIGAAIATTLAECGCHVLVVGRRLTELQKTTAGAQAGKVTPIAGDVTNRPFVESVVQLAVEQHHRIDILVNCAGINTVKRSIAAISTEDWERVIRVNTTGAFHCIQAVLPTMRQQKQGTIINISSVAGMRAGPIGGVAYNASKFAMTALGTTVGEEERENGIRVTNLFPGEVDTPILDHRPTPISPTHRQRILQPSHIAAAVKLVVELPIGVRIPELVMIPTSQSFV